MDIKETFISFSENLIKDPILIFILLGVIGKLAGVW